MISATLTHFYFSKSKLTSRNKNDIPLDITDLFSKLKFWVEDKTRAVETCPTYVYTENSSENEYKPMTFVRDIAYNKRTGHYILVLFETTSTYDQISIDLDCMVGDTKSRKNAKTSDKKSMTGRQFYILVRPQDGTFSAIHFDKFPVSSSVFIQYLKDFISFQYETDFITKEDTGGGDEKRSHIRNIKAQFGDGSYSLALESRRYLSRFSDDFKNNIQPYITGLLVRELYSKKSDTAPFYNYFCKIFHSEDSLDSEVDQIELKINKKMTMKELDSLIEDYHQNPKYRDEKSWPDMAILYRMGGQDKKTWLSKSSQRIFINLPITEAELKKSNPSARFVLDNTEDNPPPSIFT